MRIKTNILLVEREICILSKAGSEYLRKYVISDKNNIILEYLYLAENKATDRKVKWQNGRK
jgi:hypothetical protein